MEKSYHLRRGIKIYDDAWHTEYGWSAEQLADWLNGLQFTFVIHISSALPRGVQKHVAPENIRPHDIALRQALKDADIFYFVCMDYGNDLDESFSDPSLIPVDQFGQEAEVYDWYLGIPPYHSQHTALKQQQLCSAIDALNPEGIHIGFIRWPGFWEYWVPGRTRQELPEYSFDPATLGLFVDETGVDIPCMDAPAAYKTITESHRPAFTDWKCRKTVQALTDLILEARKLNPELQVAINTTPFFEADFSGAQKEVFGQDIAMLAEVVDVFEVMAYHQIMKQTPEWSYEVSEDIHLRAKGQSEVIFTTQVCPWYTDKMHAEFNRDKSLPLDDAIYASGGRDIDPLSGHCFFNLTDMLSIVHSPANDVLTLALSEPLE